MHLSTGIRKGTWVTVLHSDREAFFISAVIALIVSVATPDILPGESKRYVRPWAKKTVIFIVVACFFFMLLAPQRYPQ